MASDQPRRRPRRMRGAPVTRPERPRPRIATPRPPTEEHRNTDRGSGDPSPLARAMQFAGAWREPEIGGTDDPAEKDADQLADRALASSPDRRRVGSPAPTGDPGAADGLPIPEAIRDQLERRFGADFSGVRMHTGPPAAAAARSLSAQAFTVGSDIAFGAGRYKPHTRGGERLLAHELAHVVQDRTQAEPVVRRQPDPSGGGPLGGGGGSGYVGGGGSSGGGGAGHSYGGPTAGPAPAGDAFVVELKGTPLFTPSRDLAVTVQAGQGAVRWVSVRFGSVASGEIPIYWGTPPNTSVLPQLPGPPTGYQTPEPRANLPAWGINLHHPAFPSHPLAVPVLWIRVRDSVVSGAMGWRTTTGLAADPARFRSTIGLEELYGGFADFEDLHITGEITDALWNGRFRYAAEGLRFTSAPFTGTGRLRAEDENYEIDARLDVPVEGLPADATIPIKEKTAGFIDTLRATKTWKFDRKVGDKGGRLTGNVIAVLGRGLIDVRGTARYSNTDPRITGTVSLLIVRYDEAVEAVRDQLGPDAPPAAPPAAGGTAGDRLAITGWGQLDFALSEWLTGNAEVIVHPEGYVTARGELLPTVVIGLFMQKYKESDPAEWSASKTVYGLPWIAEITADAEATLAVYGWIGPGTLHDLRVTGLISNHPAIVNRFDFGGSVGLPAALGLKLTASVGLSAKTLKQGVASATVNAEGNLELQLYAEAVALAGRRPSAGDPQKPEYFVKGHLDANAELLLRLKLALQGQLAFWRPKLDLLDKEWSLGHGAARAQFEYVLGRPGGSSFSVDFGSIAFDPGGFAEAIARKRVLDAKGYSGKVDAPSATTSDAVNPNAPVPPGPPPTGPPGPAAAPAITSQLTESLTMFGEDHRLLLQLGATPDLEMASRSPSTLLGRIGRVRRALPKSAPGPTQLRAQLADLDIIEAQARQVLAAADRVAKGSPYLTPSVPGFRQLAQLIERYAIKYHTTDLEVALAGVSVDPQAPATVLHKFPDLAADKFDVATVSRILANGVDAPRLRKIVDNHQPRQAAQLKQLLLHLDLLMGHHVVGWQSVIAELAVGGNMLRGASWVLTYIDTYGSWTDLSLEVLDPDAANPNARRWDAWMNGKLYEFKWWYAWSSTSSRTFLRQILNDYRRTRIGDKIGLYWVFGPSPLTLPDILSNMTAALDEVAADLAAGRKPAVPGYTPAIVEFIRRRLTQMVRKAG